MPGTALNMGIATCRRFDLPYIEASMANNDVSALEGIARALMSLQKIRCKWSACFSALQPAPKWELDQSHQDCQPYSQSGLRRLGKPRRIPPSLLSTMAFGTACSRATNGDCVLRRVSAITHGMTAHSIALHAMPQRIRKQCVRRSMRIPKYVRAKLVLHEHFAAMIAWHYTCCPMVSSSALAPTHSCRHSKFVFERPAARSTPAPPSGSWPRRRILAPPCLPSSRCRRRS
mmetsp:Transcript_3001/g.8211  ORF Transcript_3001/g.8211 Transcript_3001/m.8211 type:complete len:231 (+) Transcript_3001:132-824(+)